MAAKMESWRRARKLHYEVRSILGDGWKPPQDPTPLEEQTLAGVGYAASALFPTEWWQALNAELLAKLVVDAFAGAFCDALLDGAATLLETAEGWAPPLPRPLAASASEPALPPPARPLGAALGALPALASPGGGQGGGRQRPGGAAAGAGGQGGGAASGSEAWTTKRYHACQQLDSLKGRIQRNTELQRPRRRITSTGRENKEDLRKYNWPMTATNFPEVWDRTTRPPPSKPGSGAGQRHVASQPGLERSWLLDIGRDGKTTFPYSLASHRAFLEAQPDPILKEKAMKLAPLRMTGAW